MSAAVIQLLVLAGIAVFLILRLRAVLGTRDGFEKPAARISNAPDDVRRDFSVVEGGIDSDITDHVSDGTKAAKDLAAMKMAEPGFSVSEFLHGARGAYEMVLMAFERGDLDQIRPFLSADVYNSFAEVVAERESQGLVVEAEFIGLREISLDDAAFDRSSQEGELTVKFIAELTSVVRDTAGKIIEGNPNEYKRQKDIWTFAREMGSDDPNWLLVATGG